MRVSLIAAVAENGVIGYRGALPWHLPDDLRRFKALTMGHHLIVGRRTFESIGRGLPGRRMVVLSRRRASLPDGVAGAVSLEEALRRAEEAGDDEVFVAGGAEVYGLALPHADRLYLTRVHAAPQGDTFFPTIDLRSWHLVESEAAPAATFLVYDRSAPPSPPSTS
jgi:dihydrofolate reductase